MSAYDDVLARSPLGQPMTVTLPGGYTISFTARTSTPAGMTPRALAPVAFPTLPGVPVGGSNYTGVPGSPALYQAAGVLPNPGSVDNGWTEVALTDITVTDSSGATVSGYAFALAEVEATTNQENLTWTSDQPIELLESVGGPQTGTTGCEVHLTGLGTNTVQCDTPSVTDPTQVISPNTNLIMRADSPTAVSESMGATLSGNQNAIAFGIVTSKIQVTKDVAGRVRGSDSFDVSATSPEGSTVGSARTGSANTATTGELTVLPRTTDAVYTLGEVVTPGSGTVLSDYAQSWACTKNGAADPSLPSGDGTSKSVSPEPGDLIQCTVTNTAKPVPPAPVYDLQITKSSDDQRVRVGDVVTYTLTARNNGPDAAPAGAVVRDTVPEQFTVLEVTGEGGGQCTRDGREIRCTLPALAANAEIAVRVRVRADEDGGTRNVAFVDPPVDPRCTTSCDPPANNQDDEEVEIVKPKLGLTKGVNKKTLRAGQTATYTIRVRNPSDVTLRNVKTCDDLPSGLVYVSSSPKAKLSKGKYCWTAKTLGAGKSKTYKMTVRALTGTSGTKVNHASATSPDARTKRAKRSIRVRGGQVLAGGVTG